jgi:hypothetical protein
MIETYPHSMAAHCETGTIAAHLRHAGMAVSEQMVFGISSGIFFAYLKSARLAFPMFVVRTIPGDIRKKLVKRLGLRFRTSRFSNPDKARQALDALLAQKIPVAVQVDFFCMEYIPEFARAHFNGHFITVLGKENDEYLVSDCYFPHIARLASNTLDRARFAGGDLAPHGLMFTVDRVATAVDLRKPVLDGLRGSCRNMLKIPMPFIGIKGMRLFAKKIMEWPSLATDQEFLSHQFMAINLTLEERGTGGAGFRFIFASFLQEAAKLLGRDDLSAMSRRMMTIGDNWRELSLAAARIGKNHDFGSDKLKELQGMILARADEEQSFFTDLSKMVK